MKWLFATLLGLNLIVFAGMIAGKMWKEYKPAPQQTANTQPTQIIINTNDLPANSASNVVVSKGTTSSTTSSTTTTTSSSTTQKTPPKQPPVVAAEKRPPVQREEPAAQAQAKVNYKNCSARVSMPEDDYHRIKGLLGKYPHAASRQVVEGGENGAQSSSRMNVLFMSVSDQDAGAIQAVVGRYGQLNRAPCNK